MLAVETAMRDEVLTDFEPSRDVKSELEVQSNPPSQRGPCPQVPRRGAGGYNSITDYSHSQLVSLVRWTEPDTLLRTDEDVMREMMTKLAFRRSGSRIRAAIDSAIRDAHRSGS